MYIPFNLESDINYRYEIEFGKLGKLFIVSVHVTKDLTASLNKFYSIIFLRK